MNLVTEGKEVFFPTLLSSLHNKAENGLLTVKSEGITFTFHIEKGRILGLSSSRSEDRLSNQIIESGMISPWDVELAQQASDTKKGRFLGSLLVDMGLAKQEMIIDQLNKKLQQTLNDLFQKRVVVANFTPDNQPVTWKIQPTKTTADLILTAARSIDSAVIIDSVLGDPQKFIALSPDVRLRYQQAKTTKLEKAILHMAEKSPKIENFLKANQSANRFELLRTIFGLTTAGFLVVTDKPVTRDSLSIPAREEEATPSRQDVVKKFRAIGLEEPAAFLELTGNKTKEEVKKQYEKLLKLYHPDQSAHETLSDLTHQLEAIFLELTHTYNILMNRKKAPKPKKSEKDEKSVASDTLMRLKTASTNYQYALRMLSDSQLMEAVGAMQMAVENEPDNAFYLFKQAQVLRRIPGKEKEAELSYRRALNLDPLNTDIMLDLASLYWDSNMKAKAKGIMKQAFEMDPSNRHLQDFWTFLQGVGKSNWPLWILLLSAGLILGLILAQVKF